MRARERAWWQDGWRCGHGLATDEDPLLPGPLEPGDLDVWRAGLRAGREALLELRAEVGAPAWMRGLL